MMRLVQIEWVDSYGCSAAWQELDLPLEKPRFMTCKSVGWLAHDGDDYKVLIPHLADAGVGEPSQGCGDMSIPSRAVLVLQDLVPQVPGQGAAPSTTEPVLDP